MQLTLLMLLKARNKSRGCLYQIKNRRCSSEVEAKPKRYEAKRYRFRWMKRGNEDDRWKPLSLNEYGEYNTKYGDWLHNARETVHVRDRRIWDQEFRKLRKKYRQEYQEKFRQRLAKFTRIADTKMYEMSLQKAQKKERQRLSNIRINALEAANNATKARKRMEIRRKNNIIRYDLQDAKRDVIREMIWEKPEKNWIVKENFNDMMNMKLMDDCFENVDEEYMRTVYPGLPQSGYYDTMEGLFRHSDKYFDIENENNLQMRKEIFFGNPQIFKISFKRVYYLTLI